MITNKSAEGTVVLNFSYGLAGNLNSGCSVDIYSNKSGTYTPNYGTYGYNPYPLYPHQYLIRGYGKPYHNFYYSCLILRTSNKNIQITSRYNYTYNDNLATMSSMSIEYHFKPNVTYEISLLTHFVDNRKLTESKHSEGFPSLIAELRDSPVLSNIEGACENNLRNWGYLVNYHRSYTLEDNTIKDRNITFKFSPTEQKNALIISLIPKLTEDRTVEAPYSDYTMLLPTVTIKELPFDPSINVSGGGGRR